MSRQKQFERSWPELAGAADFQGSKLAGVDWPDAGASLGLLAGLLSFDAHNHRLGPSVGFSAMTTKSCLIRSGLLAWILALCGYPNTGLAAEATNPAIDRLALARGGLSVSTWAEQ
jgi:hypothetical protein